MTAAETLLGLGREVPCLREKPRKLRALGHRKPAIWGLERRQFGHSFALPEPEVATSRGTVSLHGAAKESNLPSVGLPRPAGFEDQMGHQTPAAPFAILDTRS